MALLRFHSWGAAQSTDWLPCPLRKMFDIPLLRWLVKDGDGLLICALHPDREAARPFQDSEHDSAAVRQA